MFPKTSYTSNIIQQRIHDTCQGKSSDRLIVFGDSFAAHDINGQGWPDFLSWDMDRCLINYAEHGTSLYYSVQAFFDYFNKDYRPTDIIVFIVTSYTRLPVLHPGASPVWQGGFLRYIEAPKRWFNRKTKKEKYYRDNYQTLNFLATSLCSLQEHRNLYRLFVEFFNKNIGASGLVINAFPETDPETLTLSEISQAEGISVIDDLRVNHLSHDDNKLLTTAVNDYFTRGEFRLEKYWPDIKRETL